MAQVVEAYKKAATLYREAARRQPVEPRFRPFCSERCRLQDLARWVDGDYRVAGEPVAGDAISPEASDVDDE